MADDPIEARAWMAAGGCLASDGFKSENAPRAFVDELYAAGATLVEVRDDDALLVVHVPPDAERRARFFAIYNEEAELYGEGFGGEEPLGHEMTAEEALAFGNPDAEGQWVLDSLLITDTGQS